MTTVQQQARALGEPTRHAIFSLVREAEAPVGVAELTEKMGLNHNAVRQHLAKLVDAGLIVQATAAPHGPGRPRLTFTADPSATGPWSGPGAYQRLSLLLLEVLRSGRTPEEVGRAAAPRFKTPNPTGETATDIASAMDRQGFGADIEGADGTTDIVLRHCPFASAADEDRATVCGLHLGIARGLADGTDLDVAELVAHDPNRADCIIRLVAAGDEPASPRLTLTPRR